MLQEHKENPTIIYIHCQAGIDRTGELSGAYMLTYLSKSLEDVTKISNDIAGGEISKYSLNALKWYNLLLSLL